MKTHIKPHVSCLKRISDLTISTVILLLTWPLFIVIALLIKLTSKGPVIYCQRRVGQILPERTKFFIMYKFRTMTNKAESVTGAVWAVENDPRLTILGKVLRKTRLDELPQLFNVLRGDMSLIGPRPERPEIAIKLENQIPYYLERTYGVLPGITGLAQVYQGYDASIDDVKSKILYDFAYSMSLTKVAKWIKMDCIIIFRTIWIMILGRGR